MKKILALILALVMVASMAACNASNPNETTASTEGTTAPTKAPLTGTMEELITKLTTEVPVEFMGGTMPIDLTDTSEDGLWNINRFTGLSSAENLSEAYFFEPMMGSIAYSLVCVRLTEGADAQAVAKQMKEGIDPRKWICVEANDIKVAGYCDVIMLIMVDNQNGMSAQAYVDAFQNACGGELDFVI